MPNDPINNASVSMIKQIQLSNIESYAALRTSALATGTVNLDSTSTVITAVTNLPEGLTLTDGVLVLITNNVVSSASGWTLNVDNTGPKPVYSSLESSTRTSTIFKLNTSLLFRYNATRVNEGCWDVYGYDESFQKGLDLANSAYQKPSDGIPATDLANTYAGSASASGPANLSVAIPFGQVDSTSTATAFTV